MITKVDQRILPELHKLLIANWQGREELESRTKEALEEAGHEDLASDFKLVPTILVDNLYTLEDEPPIFKVMHADICFSKLPLKHSKEVNEKWWSGVRVFEKSGSKCAKRVAIIAQSPRPNE